MTVSHPVYATSSLELRMLILESSSIAIRIAKLVDTSTKLS